MSEADVDMLFFQAVKLNDNQLLKILVDYYKGCSEDYLKYICENIAIWGSQDILDYVLQFSTPNVLDHVLSVLISRHLQKELCDCDECIEEDHDENIKKLINSGADINNIDVGHNTIRNSLSYLISLGYTNVFNTNELIDSAETTTDIRKLVEAGLDLNYIEERLGLK